MLSTILSPFKLIPGFRPLFSGFLFCTFSGWSKPTSSTTAIRLLRLLNPPFRWLTQTLPASVFFLLVKSSLFMLPRHFCCIQSSRQGAGAKLSPAGCSLTGGKQLPRCHRLNLQLAAADGDLLRHGFVLYHGNFTPVNSQFSMENG